MIAPAKLPREWVEEFAFMVRGVSCWGSARVLGVKGLGLDLMFDHGFICLEGRIWSLTLRLGVNW